ncbi:hypothetical protein [Paractinoplanes hotanensis]|uniref:Uncharacterized protein n=1 Tax=Paractinoplanes hotanensis TaxID=2906497 RepID=A0ABT0XXB8_9ACTN|nr:hypothetical protein [Actinoplanes hotanensis]MCM4077883.1 hypothetical protein [Actinoplanes hotanensis]
MEGLKCDRLVMAYAVAGAVGDAALNLVGVAVFLVAVVPLAWGFGRDAGNPAVLPRPYGTGLGLVLAAIAVIAVAGRKGIERWRRRRRPPPAG